MHHRLQARNKQHHSHNTWQNGGCMSKRLENADGRVKYLRLHVITQADPLKARLVEHAASQCVSLYSNIIALIAE